MKSDLRPLMRLADRAGFEQSLEAIAPEAFIDHHGDVHMGFPAAERLAIAFAQNEPELVRLEIGSWEDTVLARRGRPGTPFHGFVLEQEAVHALARKWAGAPTRLNQLEAENGRLRELLMTACRELELAGKEAVAAKLTVGVHIV
ncbi:MAG: hypothetical protein LC118_05255 [Dehalococcoidia bacterium]|nr:hypothetical protein [Dehalococcoidia bacterium]